MGQGWQTERFTAGTYTDDELAKPIAPARERLTSYPNQTGAGAPDGLTLGAKSLWLMQGGKFDVGKSEGSRSQNSWRLFELKAIRHQLQHCALPQQLRRQAAGPLPNLAINAQLHGSFDADVGVRRLGQQLLK